jgi:hypothetical protein
MTSHTQLKAELTKAMRAKDQVRLTTLRSLLTALTNEAVSQKQKPDTELPDDVVMNVLKRAAKQRKDSVEQFTKGDRAELAEKEKQELAIIESFLPQMMNQDEIRKLVEAKKSELGMTDPKDKGKLMATLMQELKGKADGADVKTVVDQIFT